MHIINFQDNKQSKTLPETVLSNPSLLQAYHIDQRIFLQLFKTLQLSLFIKGGKRSIPYTKAVSLPITRGIFLQIARYQSINGDE